MKYSTVKSPRIMRRRVHGCIPRKIIGTMIALAFICIAEPSIPKGQRPVTSADGQVQSAFGDFGAPDPVLAKRQLRLLNVERQRDMVSDADKLLALAKALNAEVETGDSESLTLEQMHEVDQIEKLAKSVRSKMALTIGGNTLSPVQVVVP